MTDNFIPWFSVNFYVKVPLDYYYLFTLVYKYLLFRIIVIFCCEVSLSGNTVGLHQCIANYVHYDVILNGIDIVSFRMWGFIMLLLYNLFISQLIHKDITDHSKWYSPGCVQSWRITRFKSHIEDICVAPDSIT